MSIGKAQVKKEQSNKELPVYRSLGPLAIGGFFFVRIVLCTYAHTHFRQPTLE